MATQIHLWKYKIDLLLVGAGKASHEYSRKELGFTCGVNQFEEMLQQVAWLLKRKKKKRNRVADTSKAA